MQLCDPKLGLEKFVESYDDVLYHRAPDWFINPADPHTVPKYTKPEDSRNWSLKSESAKEATLFEENFRITRHPLWQEVSGMYSRLPKNSPIITREHQTSKLAIAVYHLIGAELKLEEEKPLPFHTTFWDPIDKICHQLEIARSKLDALSRESTGMSTNEMVDRHRVARIKTKLYKDFVDLAEAWSKTLKPHALEKLSVRDAKFA